MPKVSVIIPCFNDGAWLPEAIASIRDQTFKDWEIIVVNDGSTDKHTLDILAQLNDDRTRVLQQENLHLSAARNNGIRQSTGEIIVTLDADDRFHKSFIQKAVSILEENREVGIVSSYVQNFGKNNRVWRPTATDDFSFFTENRVVACCAFRRSCWEETGGYDENMKFGLEDWEFWIRITQKGWKVHIIKEKLFYYRKKESSMLLTDSHPRMKEILDYMIKKHHNWYMESLKKGIAEKLLINKKTLTTRRIIGLLWEKLNGKF